MSFWRRNALKHISGSGSCCWNIITIIAKKSYHKSSWDWEQGRWNAFIPCSHNLFKNDKYFYSLYHFILFDIKRHYTLKQGSCLYAAKLLLFLYLLLWLCGINLFSFVSWSIANCISFGSSTARLRIARREKRSNPQKFRKSKLILRHRRASKTMVSGIDCGLICFCVFGQLSNVA